MSYKPPAIFEYRGFLSTNMIKKIINFFRRKKQGNTPVWDDAKEERYQNALKSIRKMAWKDKNWEKYQGGPS